MENLLTRRREAGEDSDAVLDAVSGSSEAVRRSANPLPPGKPSLSRQIQQIMRIGLSRGSRNARHDPARRAAVMNVEREIEGTGSDGSRNLGAPEGEESSEIANVLNLWQQMESDVLRASSTDVPPSIPIEAVETSAAEGSDVTDLSSGSSLSVPSRNGVLSAARAAGPPCVVSTSPIASLFFPDLEMEGEVAVWGLRCFLETPKHTKGKHFKTFAGKSFRISNVYSHIQSSHCLSEKNGFWRGLLTETFKTDIDIDRMVKEAELNAWSLHRFAEWARTSEKTAWVSHVCAAFRGTAEANRAHHELLADQRAGDDEPRAKRHRTLSLPEAFVRAAASDATAARAHLAIRGAIACADMAVSFRSFDRQSFRGLISNDSGQDKLPRREHVRQALAWLHVKALEDMQASLRRAPGFSIAFDAWTSRGNHASYLGLILSHLDEFLVPHHDLFCLIHLTGVRQDYMTLAVAIAKKLEEFTSAEQFLVGAVTDNGRNVVKAARELITNYAGLIVPQEVAVSSLEEIWEDAPGVESAGGEGNRQFSPFVVQDEAFVSDVRAMEQIEAAEAVDPLSDSPSEGGDEASRAHQCVDHDLNLCVLDVLKDADLLVLVHQIDAIVAAVSRSTRRQSRLEDLQRRWGVKVAKLQMRGVTRWNSLQAELNTFLSSLYPLTVMNYKDNAFVGLNASFPTLLRRSDDLRALEAVMDLVAASSRLLEGSSYLTLPHVPFVVSTLLSKLSDSENPNDSSTKKRIRGLLRSAIQRRLGKHLCDGTLPTVQAALLMPCYPLHLNTIGITHNAQTQAFSQMLSWIEHLSPPPPASVRHDSNVPIYLQERVAPQFAVDHHGHFLATLDELQRRATALPDFSLEGLRQANADFVAFWSSEATSRLEHRRMVRLVMSMSASSACVEQVFSGAALQNSSLRTRMGPAMLDSLIVVQRYVRQYGISALALLGSKLTSEEADSGGVGGTTPWGTRRNAGN